MGEVYRARDPKLGSEVAIKVLPAEALHTGFADFAPLWKDPRFDDLLRPHGREIGRVAGSPGRWSSDDGCSEIRLRTYWRSTR
jgi:hypothetical protein